MGNKRPAVVVTDGDHIMRASILHVFPSTVHRLCGWCLDKNARSNVKEGEFEIRFARLMYNHYTEDEFEEKWRALVHEFNLHDNELMRSTYEKRHSWAETFLRGQFLPGMRTTQHCESVNSFLQLFLDSKHLLRNFVCQIDSAIAKIRFRETQDDFNTKHASPQLPHAHVLLPYFRQLSQTVTRNVYNLFKNEMDDHSSYYVTSEEYTIHHREIVLSKFMSGEVRHRVRYYSTQNHLSCTCMLLESDGIPCSHIFTVIKHLSLPHVPDSLILPRWRKDVKAATKVPMTQHVLVPDDIMEATRLSSIADDLATLGVYASKSDEAFVQAKQEIN